ncbi:MAG: FAD-dependent oxidoreductase, partial [Proteobacteria bacterium]|nr:FAD-dependent oxidoreductase [Pseudomonadota bacterium]
MIENANGIEKNSRIAIIGAGPAGLSTAWFLGKQGFRNVTVLEKLGRVGGLCKSLTIDGMSYDLGANYITWAYTETRRIAKEVGAKTYKEKPYTSIEIMTVSEDKETARYRPLKEAVLFNPFTKEPVTLLEFIVAAFRYLWLRLQLVRIIDRRDYLARIDDKNHPELCVSFKHWLRENKLDALASLFEFPVTIMGYGQLRDIAAPYVLRYISLKTFFPMIAHNLPLVGPLFELLLPWPRRFTLGFQRMWQKVAWRTNVRLNIKIKKITRNLDSTNAPIQIEYQTLQQELNNLDTVDGSMEFDYLILACPLTPDVFQQLGLERTKNEVEMSRKIKVNPYCMTTYWVENMQMPQPIAPILPLPERGRPWAVARQFQHNANHFTQFYTRTDASECGRKLDKEEWDRIEAEVKAEVRKLIDLLGGHPDETHS